MVSKVKVSKKRIEKNRDFCVISACASVKPCSLIVYKTNGHKRTQTVINREFAAGLFKTHRFRENLAFSVWERLRYKYLSFIKDWIAENKKNGRTFSLNSEFSLKLKRLRVNRKCSMLQ